MRNPAFLLLPLALLGLAPRAASAQEFGAIVMPPEPRGPTPDMGAMRMRSRGLLAGGVVVGSLGLVPLIGGAVFLQGLKEPQPVRCTVDQGLAGIGGAIGCGIASYGSGLGYAMDQVGGAAL